MPHLFDYLYFVFGSNPWGKKLLIVPCLWLAVPICRLIQNPDIGIPLAIAVTLIPYLIIDYIYDRTGGRVHFVRSYFENTKYSKFGWKALTFAAWIILWVVIPIILLKLGWI